MLKYVVYHPDDFENSYAPFILGMSVIFVQLLGQFTNLVGSFRLKDEMEIIGRFVSYSLLLSVQDIYLKSRPHISMKRNVIFDNLIIVADRK